MACGPVEVEHNEDSKLVCGGASHPSSHGMGRVFAPLCKRDGLHFVTTWCSVGCLLCEVTGSKVSLTLSFEL